MPIVDDHGALEGVITERALARRYIRESRDASRLDAPTSLGQIAARARGRAAGRGAAERGQRPRVRARDGRRVAAGRLRRRRRGGRRRPPEGPAGGDRGRRRADRHQQRQPPGRRRARARRRARRAGGVLAAGLLRDQPHDHARGAVQRADGPRAADRAPRRPAGRRQRHGHRGRLPRGRGGRRRRAADRARHPQRPRQPAAAARAARRPRGAGAERDRRRARGDRRDPRPPPHRLDRDAHPGARDVRPRGLDGHARDRALPPGGDGAHAARPRRCCSARSSPTR